MLNVDKRILIALASLSLLLVLSLFTARMLSALPLPLKSSLTQASSVELKAYELIPKDALQTVIPQGSTRVSVLKFQLASEKDEVVDRLVAHQMLFASSQAILTAKLVVNGEQVARSHVDDGTRTITWEKLALPIVPGGNVIAEVVVDFASSSIPSQDFQFQIGPQDIHVADSEHVNGVFVVGRRFEIGPLPATTVTISNYPSILSLPRVGNKDQIIARLTVGTGDHDILLKEIGLREAGHLSFDQISNIRLRSSGSVVSARKSFDKDLILFSLPNILIKKKRQTTLTVLADIGQVTKADTVRLYLLSEEDVHAFDPIFGYGAQIANQLSFATANCTGSGSPKCPSEGFQKRCTKQRIRSRDQDCL